MTSKDTRQTRPRLALAGVLVTGGLLAVFVIAFVTARGWPFEAGVFPQMVTVLGVVLAALHLVVLLDRRPAPLAYLAGMLVAAPVFAVLYLRFAARTSWLFSVVYAVAVSLVLYLNFGAFLGLPTPERIPL